MPKDIYCPYNNIKIKQKRPKRAAFPTATVQNDKISKRFQKESQTFKKSMQQTKRFTDHHQSIRTEAPLSHTRGSPFPLSKNTTKATTTTTTTISNPNPNPNPNKKTNTKTTTNSLKSSSYQPTLATKACVRTPSAPPPPPPSNSRSRSYPYSHSHSHSTFVPSKRHAWSVFGFNSPEEEYSETNRRTSILRSIREAGVCPQIPSKRIKRRQVTSLSQQHQQREPEQQPSPISSVSPIFKPVNSSDNKPLPSPQPSPCIEKEKAPPIDSPLITSPIEQKIFTTDYIKTLYTLMTNNESQETESLNNLHPLTLSCVATKKEQKEKRVVKLEKEEEEEEYEEEEEEEDNEKDRSRLCDEYDSSFTTPNKLHIPLLHDGPVSKQISSDKKALEREYWRRQRRVFLRTRFITDKEATYIARKVYHNTTISSNYRFITSFLSNMANYRTKWRKGLKRIAKKLSVSKEQVIDHSMLDSIWKYWITDPYVDPDLFYSNNDSVARLAAITVCAVYFTLRVMHGHMKEGQYRKALRELDSFGMTCSISLPDPTLNEEQY
ncbi:hypothetical protein PHYBLDRAFT_169313 [Phycomyces blakesleeanus NRRL 1555(-)]|uniref:Uncharacterized protein n=1 Tax=Phycomyces blakesleeanus (strain ATCC 8743b / DSM 1359 / FGSC 10004 / NBRC 33097 / NRRL 1555) TaxID=763407 RepID=A0A162X7U8_PHYB8|nr:hypothetical protein PHYBLDRAFT_169313 [Phycomyces blakesleeanus NRRL 1555(-)]OAD73055.1 hypothetical protein PHYBLDRAFT_169313 [Phycomyces blakesleeanus NRRL 1555(-)]|eukprot:XP_018291095.1 hypothetical protein PHYBLDRAFT_169313 [Phycomyces blakesleeanus NRRL 1555(-)]